MQVATPEPLRLDVHSTVLPSLNATLPVGMPEPAVTVAVNVTVAGYVAGFGLPLTVVLVEAFVTDWVTEPALDA